MAIQGSELIWRTSALASDTTPAQNGGRMAASVMVDNAANNLFPNVTQAQRLAGLVTWRKDFAHVASAEDVAFMSARLWINQATPGADWCTFSVGTQTDTQDTHSAAHYGSATLLDAISAGATTLSLLPENMASATALTPWRVGQKMRISNAAYDDDGATTTWATISAVAYAADRVNITIAAPGAAVAHAAGTFVAGVWEAAGDIKASATTPVVTSSAGTCTTPSAHNLGSVQQAYTLTFTSATAYTISGDTLGALGSGTTSSTTAPANPATSSPYFTLPSTAFGGTFVAGDTITFTTTPAAVPVWWRREVPANCPSLAGNVLSRAFTGESA